MAYKGNLDEYIRLHHSSMTQAEMARATGASTSQVSRRVIALRESGQLQPRRRDSDAGPAPDERLQALDELVALLHSELAASGGQSLARVSAEYRKALEERDKLRAEVGIYKNARVKVGLLEYLMIENGEAVEQFGGDLVKATLAYLEGEGAIRVDPDVYEAGFPDARPRAAAPVEQADE